VVIDSSAVLAILFREPEEEEFMTRILSAPVRLMSVVNSFEAGIVADHRPKKDEIDSYDYLLKALGIELATATTEQAAMAREAYRRFGKGNHPARLNLGDCFAYALSRLTAEPLLFKGDNFTLTDVQRAS
jgi:ribonuclease VapC